MRAHDTLVMELENSVDVMTAFIRARDHWIKMGGKPDVTTGTVKWYFSPGIFSFMPYYPYSEAHPLLGQDDWLYFCKTVNGKIVLDMEVLEDEKKYNRPNNKELEEQDLGNLYHPS